MKKSILQLASVAFFGIIIGKALRFAFNIVIARGLGPDALGIFAFGMVVARASSIFARAGLDQAAQKYIPIYNSNNDYDNLSGLILLCVLIPLLFGTLLSGALYISTPLLESTFSVDISTPVQLFLIGIPILAFFRVTIIATRGFKETKYTVISRDVIQSIIGIILIYAGAYLFDSIEFVIVGYLLSLVIGGLAATYFLYANDNIQLFPSKIPIKTTLAFSAPLVVVGVSSQLVKWSDVFLLGLFVSDSSLGRYHAAYQTSVILTFILTGVNAIFPSLASDLYSKGNLSELERTYSVVTKWIFCLTTLGCVAVVLFAPAVLSIFGTVTPRATLSLRILAIAQTITVSTGPVGYLLIMSGREQVETINTVVVSVLNILLNLVLIQRYGIVGASLATGLSLSIFNILRVVEVYKLIDILPFRADSMNAVLPMILSIASLITMSTALENTLVSFFICGICSLGMFITTFLFLGFNSDDKMLFRSISG